MNKNTKQVNIDTKRFVEIVKNKTITINIMAGERASAQKQYQCISKDNSCFYRRIILQSLYLV